MSKRYLFPVMGGIVFAVVVVGALAWKFFPSVENAQKTKTSFQKKAPEQKQEKNTSEKNAVSEKSSQNSIDTPQKNAIPTYTLSDKSYTITLPSGWNVANEKIGKGQGSDGKSDAIAIIFTNTSGDTVEIGLNLGMGGACMDSQKPNGDGWEKFQGKSGVFSVCYKGGYATSDSKNSFSVSFFAKDPKKTVSKESINQFLAEVGVAKNK